MKSNLYLASDGAATGAAEENDVPKIAATVTRRGKIARLPRDIRHDLNCRLDDGEPGKDLVEWLNSLDEVKEVIEKDFAGRPINEQNLSDWRQGGFRDWQRQEAVREKVDNLIGFSVELNDPYDGLVSVSERVAAAFAAELAAETVRILDQTTDPKERWQYLRQALHELNALRKADAVASRERRELEKWTGEHEDLHERRLEKYVEHAKKMDREKMMAPIHDWMRRSTLAETYGSGKIGEERAKVHMEIEQACRENAVWYDKRLYPPPFHSNPAE